MRRGQLHHAERPRRRRQRGFQAFDRRPLGHDDDGLAAEERPPQARHGQIERERGMEWRALRAWRGVRLDRPLQVVDDAALRQHDTFRRARRPGGVEHVGRLLGMCRAGRPGGGRRGPGPRVEIQRDGRGRRPGRVRPAIGQPDGEAGIGRDGIAPRRGPGRVERHVGAARFPHTEQRRDHGGRARREHAHARLWPDAGLLQPVRDPVRFRVQGCIGQLRRAVDHGEGRRRTRHLRLDERRHGGHRGERRRRLIPRGALDLPFGGRHERHVRDGPRRITRQLLERARQMARQLRDAGRVVPGARIVEPQRELAPGRHDQRQGIVAARRGAHVTHAHAAIDGIAGRQLDRIVFKDEEMFEERRPGRQPAPRLHGHQRTVFVLARFALRRLQLPQIRPDRRPRRHLHADRQRVDEQPHHLLHARQRARPPRDRRAEHHIVRPAVAAQHQGPRRLHHRVQRHLLLPRERLQRPRQRRRQPLLVGVSPPPSPAPPAARARAAARPRRRQASAANTPPTYLARAPAATRCNRDTDAAPHGPMARHARVRRRPSVRRAARGRDTSHRARDDAGSRRRRARHGRSGTAPAAGAARRHSRSRAADPRP